MTGTGLKWDAASQTLSVVVPQDVILGLSSVRVIRRQGVFVNDPITGKRVVEVVETRSAAVSISAASQYVFAATGPTSEIAVFRADTGNLIAKIPLQNISGPVNPRQVLVTPDGTRAYVALWSSSAIAVIDTLVLQEVDVDPSTPALDRISLPAGAAPFWLATDPDGRYLYVSDEASHNKTGLVYVVDINPFQEAGTTSGSASGSRFHQHVGTIEVGRALAGLRGLAVSASGKRLYVAAPGQTLFGAARNSDQPGSLHIVDLEKIDPAKGVYGKPMLTINGVGQDLYGVTATSDPLKIAVTDRKSDLTGVSFLTANADETNWTVQTVELTLGSKIDWFDINNAMSVVITADFKYAFVAGFNAWVQDVPSHDPNLYPKPVGANVGIIRDPFGKPVLLGATEGIVGGFLDNLALSRGRQAVVRRVSRHSCRDGI